MAKSRKTGKSKGKNASSARAQSNATKIKISPARSKETLESMVGHSQFPDIDAFGYIGPGRWRGGLIDWVPWTPSTKVAKDLMVTDLPRIDVNATIGEAARVLKKSESGLAFVVKDGDIVGLTSKDKVESVDDKNLSIAEAIEQKKLRKTYAVSYRQRVEEIAPYIWEVLQEDKECSGLLVLVDEVPIGAVPRSAIPQGLKLIAPGASWRRAFGFKAVYGERAGFGGYGRTVGYGVVGGAGVLGSAPSISSPGFIDLPGLDTYQAPPVYMCPKGDYEKFVMDFDPENPPHCRYHKEIVLLRKKGV